MATSAKVPIAATRYSGWSTQRALALNSTNSGTSRVKARTRTL